MAESVSTILDYLRQHHFLQAEAALKAELAGRQVSNGSVHFVQENGEKLAQNDRKVEQNDSKVERLTELSQSGLKQEVCTASQLLDLDSTVRPPQHVQAGTADNRALLSKFDKAAKKPVPDEPKEPGDQVQTEKSSKQAAGEKSKGSTSTVTESHVTAAEVSTAGVEHMTEVFWDQKDELLWVPPNKQNLLGKVHPLNEAQYTAGNRKVDVQEQEQEQEQEELQQGEPEEPKVFSKQKLPSTFGTSETPQLLVTAMDSSKNGLLQKYLPRKEEPELKREDVLVKPQVSVVQEAEKASSSGKTRTVQEDNDETTGRREGLPRLPPVRLKSVEIIPDEWISKFNPDVEPTGLEAYGLGSYLDVPVGQDISSSGTKRSVASNRLSVSHGIVEDPAEVLSTFPVTDDYPEEYWDSDDYEDDDDPGYTRRLVEDEGAFLASEINYPSEEERARIVDRAGQQGAPYGKYDDDDRSFGESYFSGEEYYKSRGGREGKGQGPIEQQGKEYDGQLLDSEELKQIRSEPAWQGFVVQGNAGGKNHFNTATEIPDLDPDDFSREIRETYLAESSGEADVQDANFRGHEEAQYNRPNSRGGFQELGDLNSAEDEQDIVLQYYGRPWQKTETNCGEQFNVPDMPNGQEASFLFGGFSFPSPSSAGDVDGSRAESGRSLWSARDISSRGDDAEPFANGFVGPDDTLASWKRKSDDSSPIVSPGEENDLRALSRSTVSPRSSDGDCLSAGERVDDEEADAHREDTEVAAAYDEEAMAVHEHFQRLQAEEEEFETFDLKIIHRKNRTGFEEEKDFQVVINSVIAGRYHVTEYLGSAAFSKAIQAHDLHTGMDVCMKIIKNNKDFFDQSLDEIKLLKYINKHDPADKHHILRLYDYFYHREHLFIVCELLRANLYEFHKYNRDSGGEVYFTMPRLQSIARQCLEALEFLHNLGLIHCDLKPENILVKSYSRCEVKVIDLGSSCFQSDHLCSYVQSRSYRAPEVILGLPYDQKIDMWSLGCILAELCSGNVLFQNDSLATLLARVVGIIGPLDPEMVAKGRESYKFLTKNNMLYDRNQETNRMEYLVPKKTTLSHRLPMGDQGFIDFVRYLLQINPKNRPSASEALQHAWLSFPYEPISS